MTFILFLFLLIHSKTDNSAVRDLEDISQGNQVHGGKLKDMYIEVEFIYPNLELRAGNFYETKKKMGNEQLATWRWGMQS